MPKNGVLLRTSNETGAETQQQRQNHDSVNVRLESVCIKKFINKQ